MSGKWTRTHPFIRIREATLGDSSLTFMESSLSPLRDKTGSVTGGILKKYAIPNWDLPRLKTYVDMLRAFGFNSVQLYDQWESYVNAGWGRHSTAWPNAPQQWEGQPRDWPAKVDALAEYARSQGLRTTLFVWGNTGFDYRANRGFWALCPNDPPEREILDRYWQHQARHAAHFDHVITHWGDPGGCTRNGCTIETALHLHNDFVRRCRMGNPHIESTFNLWMLASDRFGKWAGYEGPHTVLRSRILPREVGVCVHGEPGTFRFEQVCQIARAGRRAGVWAWYLANNEIYPSMFVCTRRLRDHFVGLPAAAHDQIAWHSVDSNNHGLNLHNLYVAGQLMQDPTTDAGAALEEFIAGAFGPRHVGPVRDVLETVEALRPLWPEAYGDAPLDVDRARRAYGLMRRVKIPEDFSPAFPMVASAAELAREMVAQTRALARFAEFCNAVRRLPAGKGAQGQRRRAAAVAHLPTVARPRAYMTHLEYCRYLAKRDAASRR